MKNIHDSSSNHEENDAPPVLPSGSDSGVIGVIKTPESIRPIFDVFRQWIAIYIENLQRSNPEFRKKLTRTIALKGSEVEIYDIGIVWACLAIIKSTKNKQISADLAQFTLLCNAIMLLANASSEAIQSGDISGTEELPHSGQVLANIGHFISP